MTKTKNFYELPKSSPFLRRKKAHSFPVRVKAKGHAKEKSLETQRLQDFFLAEKEGFERKSINFLSGFGVAVYARIAQNKGHLRIVRCMKNTME